MEHNHCYCTKIMVNNKWHDQCCMCEQRVLSAGTVWSTTTANDITSTISFFRTLS